MTVIVQDYKDHIITLYGCRSQLVFTAVNCAQKMAHDLYALTTGVNLKMSASLTQFL